MVTVGPLLFFPVVDFVGSSWDPPEFIEGQAGVAIILTLLALLTAFVIYVISRLALLVAGGIMDSPAGDVLGWLAPRAVSVGALGLVVALFYFWLDVEYSCAAADWATDDYFRDRDVLDVLLPDFKLLAAALGAMTLGFSARVADLEWSMLGKVMGIIALVMAVLSFTTIGGLMGQLVGSTFLLLSENSSAFFC